MSEKEPKSKHGNDKTRQRQETHFLPSAYMPAVYAYAERTGKKVEELTDAELGMFASR